jgi:hypothetical protein
MLSVYSKLAELAFQEFGTPAGGIVVNIAYVGGTPSDPNKLRLVFPDDSYLDVWLTTDGDYAYHWEQRRQRGRIFHWDNAPHHPHLGTFADHIHSGQESDVVESHLSATPADALREVLSFIVQHL